jgi:hypothetical protein
MLAKLLRGTDWSRLTDYLSPSFFDTMSPLSAAGAVSRLSRGYLSKQGFDAARGTAQAILKSSGSIITLTKRPRLVGSAGDLTPTQIGQALLTFYFAQLLQADTALLDYRAERFHPSGGQLAWQPSPLFMRWDARFLGEIRRMYRGFYGGDMQMFDQSLDRLGLSASRGLLMDHFGSDQDATRFQLSDFRATFHDVFLQTKAAKSQLPADFVGFGAGLLCLYEHLERLDVPLDARRAFHAAAAGVKS